MRSTAGSDSSACENRLAGRKIILGITGSVAAYKAAYIASALVQRGAEVHVVMTDHARRLIGEPTFWSITSNQVVTDLFEPPKQFEMTHVSLPESSDLMLIAPATANILAKLAYGIADDSLSTMALAVRCPVVIAPAMNVRMWTNHVVQENARKLRERGCIFVGPESGRLACGEEGTGRLVDPERIVEAVERLLASAAGDYAGVKVLVSAGPTREAIDPVRFISNRSSGKMGYALAAEAAARGASVTLVTGPVGLEAPAGVEVVRVESVREMLDVVTKRAKSAEVFFSAAAPADFVPAKPTRHKIKKSEALKLELEAAPDVLAEIGKNKGRRVLVGFAAETRHLLRNAEKKLRAKNLDLIVANDVSGGDVFGSDENKVTLISRTGETLDWPRMSKRELAGRVLDYVKEHLLEVRS